MNTVDVLIIAGASITKSPWYTWADVAIEMLQPSTIIDVSAKGTGNYFITTSCINQIQQLNTKNKNVLVMPMFTNIDKFDMYLSSDETAHYAKEKHKPITLLGSESATDQYGFWCTGGHWPLIKQDYYDKFFNVEVTVLNTIMLFYSLQQACQHKQVSLVPLFDSDIWDVLELDINNFVTEKNNFLPKRRMLEYPVVKNFKSLLNNHWYEFESLIGFAHCNNLPFYSNTFKTHPPSQVHYEWYDTHIKDRVQFKHREPSQSFIKKINDFANLWNESS